MYCSLLRIQLTLSTQIKPPQSFADGMWNLDALFNSNRPTLLMLWFRRSTNILYLLTSAVELLNDARQSRIQDKSLDMHIWRKLEIS